MKTDINVLTWIDITKNTKEWDALVQSRTYSGIPIEMDQVPPFQLVVPRTGAVPTSFTLTNSETGAVIDILADILAVGLETEQPDNRTYDLIIYKSTIKIGSGITEEGIFYADMTVHLKQFRSVCFHMKNFVGRLHKFIWCHNSDFEYKSGHMQYTESGYGTGYMNYLLVDLELGFPQWPDQIEAKERDGEEFRQKWIGRKSYEFEFHAPEWVIDAFAAMRGHDVKKLIDPDGLEYIVDQLAFEVRWVRKHWGKVEGNFFTNSMTIVVNGRGASAGTCEVAGGTCVDQTGNFYAAKTYRQFSDSYVDADGVVQPLEVGDYFLSETFGSTLVRLYVFNGPASYTEISTTGLYTKVWVENADEYWYDLGEGLKMRQSKFKGYTPLTDPWTFYGQLHPDMIGEIWVENADGTQYYVQKVTTNAEIDAGIQVDVDGINQTAVILKTGTAKCGMVQEARFEVEPDYVVFTDGDGVANIVITAADGDDSTIIGGGPDIDTIPSIP